MDDAQQAAAASLMEQVLYEVKKVVVGLDRFLERVLVALLARGHLLVEGVPGLAKTLTVNALPESQVDRLMRKVLVGYPTEEEEYVIVSRVTGAMQAAARVCTTEQLLALQKKVRELYVGPTLMQYAVKVVAATRDPAKAGLADAGKLVMFGASPRATIGMIEAGRALAFLRGRDYVLPV